MDSKNIILKGDGTLISPKATELLHDLIAQLKYDGHFIHVSNWVLNYDGLKRY